MTKQRLINRLRWYYPTELFNVFLFSGIGIWLIYDFSFQDVLFLLYGLLIVVVILFQGQKYWSLKLKALQGKQFDQQKSLNYFRNSKKLNVVLIALIPLVFVIQIYLNGWNLVRENFLGWAIATHTLGILEHINYYHVQLMIDNIHDIKYLKVNKKLKTASLRKHLMVGRI